MLIKFQVHSAPVQHALDLNENVENRWLMLRRLNRCSIFFRLLSQTVS